uniref:Uncharacterized protein n=1 Tax=uncultured marine bacterium 313 TaxID=257386 RepID=Q6SHQ1_9BACT|nr:hypothetical protein MBMO_EBAC750-11E01.13 [uncultured marine bacterium 313]
MRGMNNETIDHFDTAPSKSFEFFSHPTTKKDPLYRVPD